VNTDERKTISGGMWVNLSFSDEGRTFGSSLSPYVNLKISQQLQANVGFGISHDNNNTQWYGNFTDSLSATHYTFAHLRQHTVSMSARVNYALTPDLTFEFYGQPFVSTGDYWDVRELSSTPDADSYADRFKPYSAPATAPKQFKFTQLRTNSVVRWEYRPGSTLFVVWAHGRQDDTNPDSRQSWARDYRGLLDLHPDNTFLVKLAYWMNR
jgi:hypothetical protein